MKKVWAYLLVLVLAISLVPQGLFTIDVFAASPTNGTTGYCTWVLDGTELTISGNSAMGNYSSSSAAPWGTDITSVTISPGVTSIGAYAFYDCSNLTSVSLPDSLGYIGGSAFRKCTKLSSIIIPNSVRTIDTYAFSQCSGLTVVTLSNTLKGIGDDAFSGCSSLISIVIPNSVTSLGISAFANCSELTTVTLSNSITSIRGAAFSACSKLTTVIIPDSITIISTNAFAYCDDLTSVGYTGSMTDRNRMTIEYNNEYLTNATWYYNLCDEVSHTYTDGCDDECNTCQWPRMGEHIYDNSLDQYCNSCGHVRTFEEFPIVSLSAEPQTIIEKTGGWMSVDSNGNEWYRYSVYSNTYTITLADGLTFSGHSGEFYSLMGRYPQLSDSQSYINQWGIGEHTVTLSLGDITGEATVTIIENPIRAITVEPITVVEGTNCNYTSFEDDGELKVWTQYVAYMQTPKFTLIMKDGTSFTGSREDIYAKYGVSPAYSDDQSYDNPWGVGAHAMTVSIGDVTGTVPYIIIESPIASISAAPITLYEGIYTYSRRISGGSGSTYRYDEIIPITVTYKDGTSFTGTLEEIYDVAGISGYCYDNQSYENPWGLGAHKVNIYLGHLSCELDITIVPNPIERIELVDVPKTEFTAGEFFDLSGAVLRVHFNDGTSEDIAIPNFSVMDGVYYYCNKIQAAGYLHANMDGEQTYYLSYFGKNTDEYTYSYVDHAIQSVSVKEENKNLIITITYDDNTTKTLTALGLVPRMGDSCSCGNHPSMYGDLYTDQGVYFAGFIPGCDGSLRVEMGEVSSNSLPNGSNWFTMYMAKYISDWGISYVYLVEQLGAYNGKITADNIDAIITYVSATTEIAFKDGAFFDGQSLREAIMTTFAVDSVDLSLSTRYDSENDRYPADGFGGRGFTSFVPSLVYKNEYWEMCYPTYTDHVNSYIRFDDEGRILRFSMRAPIITYGDPTDDMIVDSRDLVLIRKFMADFDYDTNTSTVEVAGGADTNGDGVIDARDLVLLRQYFANYDYDSGSSSVVLGPQN